MTILILPSSERTLKENTVDWSMRYILIVLRTFVHFVYTNILMHNLILDI